MRSIFFVLLLCGSLQAMSKASREMHIGVHTARYEDVGRNRPVTVEIWYPTYRTGPLDQPEDLVWVHPEEIRDVPIAGGKYPLILMSHGHGGDRRDRSWIVEYLVKSGFIVASVEHYGNSCRNYHPLLTLRFWDRAKDVSFAISELLKDPLVKKQLDFNRIGFIGYSLGGMTGLTLGGAKIENVKEIVSQYLEKFREMDIKLMEKVDFSEAKDNFTDQRIKALVLLSPAAFGFSIDSFKNIKIPVALVASEGDEVLPFQDHALKLIEYLKPAKLKLFRDKISHYVFLNRVSNLGRHLMRQDIQTEDIQTARLRVHKEVGDFITAFFKEHFQYLSP